MFSHNSNNLLMILASVGITTISNLLTFPAQAASFEKASFIDNFDDGVVNSSIYSSIENASIVEENGAMTVTGEGGDGISISLDDVLPEGDGLWFGFDVELIDFANEESLLISFIESDEEAEKFTSFEYEIVLVDSNPIETQLNQAIQRQTSDGQLMKIRVASFDNKKNKLKEITVPFFLPKNAEGIRGGIDWISIFEGKGRRRKKVDQKWVWDLKIALFGGFFVEPEELALSKKILEGFGEATGGKRVEATIQAFRDPGIKFNTIAASEIHPIPEPSSTLGLLTLLTLGTGLSICRKNTK